MSTASHSFPAYAIRAATPADLDALVHLESACFTSDRISRRSMSQMLTRAHASILVCEKQEDLLGYVLLLFRRGWEGARIYSIATAAEARRMGVAEALVRAAEDEARQRLCRFIRLEIRKDNPGSIGLFSKLGYQPWGEYPAYYEDGQDALRFHKELVTPSQD